jgi:hypothetical protein
MFQVLSGARFTILFTCNIQVCEKSKDIAPVPPVAPVAHLKKSIHSISLPENHPAIAISYADNPIAHCGHVAPVAHCGHVAPVAHFGHVAPVHQVSPVLLKKYGSASIKRFDIVHVEVCEIFDIQEQEFE